jgi:hypothetical protein
LGVQFYPPLDSEIGFDEKTDEKQDSENPFLEL